MRESFAFASAEPLISTQVLGAITGASPSAFATSVITGVFCAIANSANKIAAGMSFMSSGLTGGRATRTIFLTPSPSGCRAVSFVKIRHGPPIHHED